MTEEAQPFESVVFQASPTTAKLDEALAKAQGEFGIAGKNKINPHFKARYADLESVVDACGPALSKHGISRTQWPLHSTDGRVHLMTRLGHSGEWMQAHFSIPAPKVDPQGFGSALTYIRRFALAAAAGVVVGDEDDDGAGAGDKGGDRIAESALADHLAAIESAATRDDLKRVYLAAAKAAERDQISLEQIIAASKRRQAAIPNGATK